MAVMIPDEPPLTRGSNESENEFWWELKEQLPDEFHVFHGLPYLKKDSRQGEVDFLVVHRRLGLLNIECKGGGIRREDGQWYRIGRGRRQRLEKSPSEQARKQLEDIVDELKRPAQKELGRWFDTLPLVYGWAVAFPFAERDDELPLGLESEVVMGKDALHDLEEAVRSAMAFYRRRFGDGCVDELQLDEEQFERFRSLINPSVEMPPVLSAQIEQENRRIERISKRQAETVRKILDIPRVRVTGGAGTGKTVLALHAARLLAAEGRDVLVTCFNSKLAEFLRESVREWPAVAGEIDVDNFHALGVEAGRQLDADMEFPDRDAPDEVRRNFWQSEVPLKLLEGVDSPTCSLGPWDAIVVDEAQDFAGDWWEILEEALRDDGRMAIFYDEAQVLFDHSSSIPEWPAKIGLYENFRNTRSIAEPVQKLTDSELQPHEDCPEGEPPSIYEQGSPSATRDKVGKLLSKFVDRQGLDNGHIAILTPHRPEHSALEGATELGGVPIVDDVNDWYDGAGVLHSTISAFKGLQAEVVILVDIDPEDERCDRNARYVAASRAINRLYVFKKGDWLG